MAFIAENNICPLLFSPILPYLLHFTFLPNYIVFLSLRWSEAVFTLAFKLFEKLRRDVSKL